MSNISISSSAQGSGTFNIASPNTDANRTLILPDEDGTVITDVSDRLGKVVQVVHQVIDTGFTVGNTNGFFDTGFNPSITKKFQDSKIYCSVKVPFFARGTVSIAQLNLTSANNELIQSDIAGTPTTEHFGTFSIEVFSELDNFKLLVGRANTSTNSVELNSFSKSTITLMEIAQ